MKKGFSFLLKTAVACLTLLPVYSCESIGEIENPDKPEQPDPKPDPDTNPDPDKPAEAPVKWISEVLEFMPAPGQFVNTSTADMESIQRLVYSKKDGKIIPGRGLVSLGGFGGYITFRFNHDVLNRKGTDFVILGNAFPDMMYPEYSNSEPGIVQVSFDENGNGLPDDTWYELKGEGHDNPANIRNYELTYYRPSDLTKGMNIRWTDNRDGEGELDVESMAVFHDQSFYPLAEYFKDGQVPEKLTFKGTRLEDNAKNIGEPGTEFEEYWVHWSPGSGYADNWSDDYEEEVNLDPDTKGGNKFDIDNAVDADGNPVVLEKITFIRVYNAIHQCCGWTGETSPEICGAISLTAPAK